MPNCSHGGCLVLPATVHLIQELRVSIPGKMNTEAAEMVLCSMGLGEVSTVSNAVLVRDGNGEGPDAGTPGSRTLRSVPPVADGVPLREGSAGSCRNIAMRPAVRAFMFKSLFELIFLL